MTGRPIDLDAHRTAVDRARIELRQRPVNRDAAPVVKPKTENADPVTTHSAQSPREEIKVMERAIFLLRRYAASRQEYSRADRTIMRAESELARLRKRDHDR